MFPFSGISLGGGTAGPTGLALPSNTYFASNGGPSSGNSRSGLRFLVGGQLQSRFNDMFSGLGSTFWIGTADRTVSIGNDYEVRLSSVTGDTGSLVGTTGVWLALSAIRDFYVEASGGPADFITNSITGTFEVREIATPANIASGTVTLTAQWEGNF